MIITIVKIFITPITADDDYNNNNNKYVYYSNNNYEHSESAYTDVIRLFTFEDFLHYN